MQSNFFKIFFPRFFFVFLISILIPIILFSVFFLPTAQAETSQEQRLRLQAELANLEIIIKEQQNIVSVTQNKSKTLANDIAILQAQINKKKAEIKSIDYKIISLSNKISDKNLELNILTDKLGRQKESLTQILEKARNLDDVSFVNLVLDNNSLSDFFNDQDNLISLQEAINQNLADIKNTSHQVTEVKNNLEDSKESQIALKEQQRLEQQRIASTQKQKDVLLKETKGQEVIYKKQLAETQIKANKIRSALFALAGGSRAISFGGALDLANQISQNISIEPAFLLAILTQESNLGSNVGGCYLTDQNTGAGISIKGKFYKNVMKASRDVTPFLKITNNLGLDYSKVQISCPIGDYGYGGAMGPAQFIPSTWMIFENKIQSLTGSFAGNPWDNLHAFTASSLYLTDLGAKRGDYLSMIKAACKYYGTGGSNCSYGKSVMKYRDSIQSNIDYLKQYGK